MTEYLETDSGVPFTFDPVHYRLYRWNGTEVDSILAVFNIRNRSTIISKERYRHLVAMELEEAKK